MDPTAEAIPLDGKITELIHSLVKTAEAGRHRYAVILSGEPRWCLETARASLSCAVFDNVLWISSRAPRGVNAIVSSQAKQILGQELDAVVFDAHSGFDADAFGAVSGTVRGGGLFFLLTPPLATWPSFADPEHKRIAVAPYGFEEVTGRFLRRLVGVIHATDGVVILQQGGEYPILAPSAPRAEVATRAKGPCRTPDQAAAVEAVTKVATGHRRRPVVLTSDRGRGKSAALGIAAAQLLQQGMANIVVTGPSLRAVEPVFDHAHRILPKATIASGLLSFDKASLSFAPPDALSLSPREADLILVDEAAAIPTPMLERLLRHYSRIVFATTVHGYEGTGRGFALRFYKTLDQHTPGWKAVRLASPIRWAAGDPLEHFAFKALMLDATAASDQAVVGATPTQCTIERVDRDALVADDSMLSQTFGLLVLAHYRTTPNDLRNLLDGPNLCVYVMLYRGHVVATALVANEGGFDADTAQAIYQGRRRPRGHLIAQSLAAHVGLEHAALLRCARLMRIAVHPVVQQRGLGSHLLNAIVAQARDAKFDYVGSSFGATVDLVRFWERSGFLSVRVGFKREATSGAHSVMMLRALSRTGEELVVASRQRFVTHLPHLLSDPLRDLDPQLANVLLERDSSTQSPLQLGVLDEHDWRDVSTFAFALRGYETCLVPIWKLAGTILGDPNGDHNLTVHERDVLITKVLQKRSWKEVSSTLGLSGRSAVIDALRQAVRKLVLTYGDEEIRREARRLGKSG